METPTSPPQSDQEKSPSHLEALDRAAEILDQWHVLGRAMQLHEEFSAQELRMLGNWLERDAAAIKDALAILDDALPWGLVKRELAHVEQEKARVAETLAQVTQRLAAQEAATIQLEHLTAYCQRVAANLTTLDFDEKRMALEALGVQVTANGPDWRLTGSIPLEAEADMMFKTSE